ncbi:MAG TPA: LytTR family DNA-binding domain-containing protein [Thermoanaerobaculia bacterium]
MRVLIADDELLARAHLQHVLGTHPDVEIVAACGDAEETLAAIAEHDPDALFLDIEMPGTNGLDLARHVEAAGRPLIVFVTAYVNYALDAFDVSPVDYVLKPAEPLRCRRALNRIQRVLDARRGTPAEARARTYLKRVFVKDGERFLHVQMDDVDAIEALGNYVKLRTRARTFVLRGSLSALESRLDPAVFIRTHRSHMVNIRRVRELVAVSHGDYLVVLHDGTTTVPLSRMYRGRLETLTSAMGDVAAQ